MPSVRHSATKPPSVSCVTSKTSSFMALILLYFAFRNNCAASAAKAGFQDADACSARLKACPFAGGGGTDRLGYRSCPNGLRRRRRQSEVEARGRQAYDFSHGSELKGEIPGSVFAAGGQDDQPKNPPVHVALFFCKPGSRASEGSGSSGAWCSRTARDIAHQ